MPGLNRTVHGAWLRAPSLLVRGPGRSVLISFSGVRRYVRRKPPDGHRTFAPSFLFLIFACSSETLACPMAACLLWECELLFRLACTAWLLELCRGQARARR